MLFSPTREGEEPKYVLDSSNLASLRLCGSDSFSALFLLQNFKYFAGLYLKLSVLEQEPGHFLLSAAVRGLTGILIRVGKFIVLQNPASL